MFHTSKSSVKNFNYSSQEGLDYSDYKLVSSSLKRKFPKSIYYPTKKKVVEDDLEEEFRIGFYRKNFKNIIIPKPSGFLRSKSSLVSSNSDDFFEKGDVQRLKNKNLNVRKKFKKVRFSDSNEIIGSNCSVPLNDTLTTLNDGELLLECKSLKESKDLSNDILQLPTSSKQNKDCMIKQCQKNEIRDYNL